MGDDTFNQIIRDLIKLGDYEYNNRLSSADAEKLVSRKPNKQQII